MEGQAVDLDEDVADGLAVRLEERGDGDAVGHLSRHAVHHEAHLLPPAGFTIARRKEPPEPMVLPMTLPRFDLEVPRSLPEVLALLAQAKGDVRLLAGGT